MNRSKCKWVKLSNRSNRVELQTLFKWLRAAQNCVLWPNSFRRGSSKLCFDQSYLFWPKWLYFNKSCSKLCLWAKKALLWQKLFKTVCFYHNGLTLAKATQNCVFCQNSLISAKTHRPNESKWQTGLKRSLWLTCPNESRWQTAEKNQNGKLVQTRQHGKIVRMSQLDQLV